MFVGYFPALTQDLSGLFDESEKGYFSSNNLIKINFVPLFQGEVPITYERCFGEYFSLEAGIGIQLPYIIPDYTMYKEDYTDFRDPDPTLHFWLSPKIYFLGGAPESMFVGLQVRKKNYSLWAGNIYFTDLTLIYGFQFFISDHFLMETNFGYGIRKTDDPVNEILEYNITMALAYKVAYAF